MDLNHSLNWMQYCPKLMDVDEDEDVVVAVEEILDTMVLMVLILQILRRGKPHCTTRNGIILRQNKKKRSVYEINFPRTMRIIAINMVWRGIGCIPVVHQTFGQSFASINKGRKNRDELYLLWWIGSNLLWHWFLWRS